MIKRRRTDGKLKRRRTFFTAGNVLTSSNMLSIIRARIMLRNKHVVKGRALTQPHSRSKMTKSNRALLLLPLLLLAAASTTTDAFAPSRPSAAAPTSLHSSPEGQGGEWDGRVASNDPGGAIRGCSIKQVGDSVTDWEISVDGVEADLGKFSEAIYKKILGDARGQQFQGFRPGQIPPQLTKTYIAFAMDECAREATLEAMAQNSIGPFESAREDMNIASVSIPPPAKKAKKKKKKKKKNGGKKGVAAAAEAPAVEEVPPIEEEAPPEPAWLTFETMKEAIDAGWKPGQSFSFIAQDVKGQRLKDDSGATIIGDEYRGGGKVDWNAIDVASEKTKQQQQQQ